MKALKTIAIVILLIPCAFSSYSQKSECKFDVDKISKISGAPIKKIKTMLTGTDIFYVIISRTDTTYSLIFNFWMSGIYRESIEKGSKVTLNLSGGDILELTASYKCLPKPHYGDQTWTEYYAEYSLRGEDLLKIKDVHPLDVSLNIGAEPFYREFDKKDNDKIRDIIRCIIK